MSVTGLKAIGFYYYDISWTQAVFSWLLRPSRLIAKGKHLSGSRPRFIHSNGNPSLSPVLITGGCGFIGYHLVKRLLEEDPACSIHVLDINTSRNRIPR